jgi:4-hydroxybenzoate polyprenyltransferase
MGLFAILFGVVFSVTNYENQTIQIFDWMSVIGILAVISFFFRLRIYDEIKDFKLDALNHPNRVLQSGKISLKTLILISLIISISEIFWSYQKGTSALIAWGIAFFYAFLMRYEFFIGSFLKKYLPLYAFLHLLIMPLIIFWIWVAHIGFLMNLKLVLLMFFSLISGFAFEIARKIHAPDAESPTIDSYSKTLGYHLSIYTTLFICIITAIIQNLFLYQIKAHWWTYCIISFLLIWIIFQYISVLKKPHESLLRNNEKSVSILMLVSYLLLILELNN